MVAAVDDFVGRILDQLDSLGLDENTVVIFTSDNGGLCTTLQQGPTSNLPLRSGKGWLYEGGIRVPFLVRAPMTASAGKTCDVPVTSIDIGPTVLELAGLSFPKEIALDGLSFTAALQNPAMSYADGSTPSDKSTDEPAALQAGVNAVSLTNRKLYWHYPHYHSSQWRPGAAIRDGRWKLIEFYETDSFELYDLANDMGESIDVKQQHPAVAEELRASLAAWQNRLGAKKPVER
jgi:arylsulfatase A-like enzyme